MPEPSERTACNAGEFDQLTAQLMMLVLFSGAASPSPRRRCDTNRRFRGHYRHVVTGTTLGGTDLPAGSHLLLLWGAANRDPAQFDAPHEFRLDGLGGKGRITFGEGAHFCVGAALAPLESQIVLRVVLDRTSWIDAVDIGPWLPSILVRRRNVWYWTKTCGNRCVVRGSDAA